MKISLRNLTKILNHSLKNVTQIDESLMKLSRFKVCIKYLKQY